MVIQPFGFFSFSGLKMFLCCTSSFGAFGRARKQLSVVWVWYYIAKNIPLNSCNSRQCPTSRQWALKNFWQVLKKLISQLPIKLLFFTKSKNNREICTFYLQQCCVQSYTKQSAYKLDYFKLFIFETIASSSIQAEALAFVN